MQCNVLADGALLYVFLYLEWNLDEQIENNECTKRSGVIRLKGEATYKMQQNHMQLKFSIQ